MARLAFLGTPDMAVPPLRALVEAGHEIALVVTRPDRRRGRGGAETPSPVKAAGLALGLPVTHAMAEVADAGVELAVVVAYGRIIPAALLAQVPMVNLHFSLLPRWRGAAPVERALLAGDTETGVCLMKVEEGLDTGAVYDVRTVPIAPDADLSALRRQLVEIGTEMLVAGLADGVGGLPDPVPQRGDPTMADKISKEDLHLHWEADAASVLRVVRLEQAWTTFRGKRLRVLRAEAEAVAEPAASAEKADPVHSPGAMQGTLVATGSGLVRLVQVQPESRSPMSAEEWVRGVRPGEGERLGSG
jgi:methionyl-tRNA formyltransferase